jgi:hypothetical protein
LFARAQIEHQCVRRQRLDRGPQQSAEAPPQSDRVQQRI